MNLTTFVLCLLTLSITNAEIISQKKNTDIEKRVKELLSKMTLEEKNWSDDAGYSPNCLEETRY